MSIRKKLIISGYLSENQEYLEENKVKVSVRTEKSGDGNQEGEGLWAVIDAREFRRVIDNIIINTIRYRTKESSCVTVELKRQDSRLLLDIADDGPGVPDENLEKIFESFCRLDASRTRCSEGSGLGLAIVKRIVLDHNGILHWGFVQVDTDTSTSYKVACFAMICHHCGERYIEFFPNARQENLFIGMIHAFTYMGIPRYILTDNMKSVVVRRDPEGHPLWQKDYKVFMETIGFQTKLCKPKHPSLKAKWSA